MRRYVLSVAIGGSLLVATVTACGGSGRGRSDVPRAGRTRSGIARERAASSPAGTIVLISQGADTRGFGISHV